MARQNVVHRRVEALEEVMPGSPGSRDLRKLMLSMGILDECQVLMQDMSHLDRTYAVRHCRNAWLCLCLVCKFSGQKCLQLSTGSRSSCMCSIQC